MPTAVGVTVLDQLGAPVDGVSVELFDRLGNLVSAAVLTGTGGAGRVEFTVDGSPGGTQYHIRAYLVGGSILYSPVLLYADRRTAVVYEPLPSGFSNEFSLAYNTGELEPAVEPYMCRCHAKIHKLNDTVFPGYVFYIRDRVIPEILYAPTAGGVSGPFLGGDRITLRTDKFGNAVTDLVRNGIYTAFFPDRAEEPCDFIVPDQPSADLIDLIWLYAKSVTYSTNALNLQVGESATVEFTQFLMSNDRERDLDENLYAPSSVVSPVASVGSDLVSIRWGTSGRSLIITALAAGTAEVIVEPQAPINSRLPVRLPRPPVTQTPISVTVT